MALTTEELNNIGIRQWRDIKGEYEKIDVLMGNGFSINFSQKFMYRSIFEDFKRRCDDIHEQLFAQFNTTNFEEIMFMLVNARKFNSIFGLSIDEINTSIDVLKNGLIASINALHPRNDDIHWGSIMSIGMQIIEDFEDVYSTNYDLLLYHIIMKTIDNQRTERLAGRQRKALQDYCWGNAGADYKEFMDYQDYPDYKHVYYLHGNLCLFNDGLRVLKLKRSNREPELINLISREILNGHFPLFVSEGTHAEKQARVSNNLYLKFCFDKLRTSDNDILIFGLTLAPNDEHIVSKIRSKPRRIVISVYPGEKTTTELQAEMINQRLKFGNNYRPSIDFVDSRSVFNFEH